MAVLKADIPLKLHMKFKSKCAAQGYKMSEVAQALTEEWVESVEGAWATRVVREWMQRNKR